MTLPSRMSVVMRRAFQTLVVGSESRTRMSARRPGAIGAELVPAKLERVVVGGGGQSFARREPEAYQHLEFNVLGDAGQRAHHGRSRCGQIVRVGSEDRLVDLPEPQRRLIGFFALPFFDPSLRRRRADGASRERADSSARQWLGRADRKCRPDQAVQRRARARDCDDRAGAGSRC